MAELAIPILALGGLYIMGQFENRDKKDKNNNLNQNQGSCQENYENLNKTKITTSYPNKTPTTAANSVNFYDTPNQATDKYFQEENFKKIVSQKNMDNGVGNNNNPMITSMTGERIRAEDFKHLNMAPFFGSKIKGAGNDFNTSESTLDHLQGSGSQQFSKREVAPLFNPEDNVQYSHGAPNQSEFYKSRVNPSLKMSNVTPWEQIQVGPGLNQGYGTSGSGGFNSGMESRELWSEKTVDELRVITNPKLTFGLDGHQGPANSIIKNLGLEGKMEKRLPDKFYASGPEKWLTTTGAEKAQTSRGIEMLQDQARQCTSTEYFGNVADHEATYVQGHYENAKRPELESNPVMASHAKNQNGASANDYGIQSYKSLPNNRTTTKNEVDFSHISGALKSVVAPLLDILRPTRKENVVGNLRLNGNVNNNTSGQQYMYNPNDATKITNRQMVENKVDMNYVNVTASAKQATNGYLVSKHQPVQVQRDTTNNKHIGIMSGNANREGLKSYTAEYNQRNNVNKQQNNVVLQGGTQIFNQYTNLSTIKPDKDRNNNRAYAPSGGTSIITSKENYGATQNIAYLSEKVNNDRLDSSILDAFRKNPYTQSLNSWA